MSKYENGKVYMITDIAYTKCYYGSTCEDLSKRLWRHKNKYKLYLQGKVDLICSYKLFDEFGVDNCKIELVENYACKSKEELLRQEGYYIKNHDCVNKVVAGRTKQEYAEDNKEYFDKYYQEYRQTNQEALNAKSRQRYSENKEEVIERTKKYQKEHPEQTNAIQRRYYDKHKDMINEKRKIIYICPCGSTTTQGGKHKHNKTQKHQNWLNQHNEELE